MAATAAWVRDGNALRAADSDRGDPAFDEPVTSQDGERLCVSSCFLRRGSVGKHSVGAEPPVSDAGCSGHVAGQAWPRRPDSSFDDFSSA